MPCNSGVSLTPIVDGKPEWFAARGLYNGLALLADETTGSYWDHITGECVHGPLVGTQLDYSDYDLVYTTVAGALQTHPHAQLASSSSVQRGLMQTLKRGFMNSVGSKLFNRVAKLPPRFTRTMDSAHEDTRRERMDLGLGLWTQDVRRYYPLDLIRAQPTGILDRVGERTLFVFYNEAAKAPDAFYIAANSVERNGDALIFDTGERLQAGKLLDRNGEALPLERPQQMFTRWYGFAYTFPDCAVYTATPLAEETS